MNSILHEHLIWRNSIRTFIGIWSAKHSWEAPLLIWKCFCGNYTKFIFQFESFNEWFLWGFKSPIKMICVKLIKIIIEVMTQFLDVVINHFLNSKWVIFIDIVQLISYVLHFVFHCEESSSNNIKSICLTQRPFFNNLNFWLVTFLWFSCRKTNLSFIMHKFIKFCNFSHLSQFIILFFWLRYAVKIRVLN